MIKDRLLDLSPTAGVGQSAPGCECDFEKSDCHVTIGRIDPFILHKEHPSVGGPGGIHRIILMDNVLSRITVSENISD